MSHVIDLTGRVALVTGAGHGIGAVIACTLSRAGAKTIVNYRQSGDRARDVVDSIVAAGGEAITIQADVTERDQVERMHEEALARWDAVDILVNNALDQKPWLPFLEQSWEVFQSQIDGSLEALCNTVWVFLPGMQARQWGRIINISSVCFIENLPTQSAYNAGKAAMYAWSRTVVREVAPDNVTINIIAPGWMRTERVDPDSEEVRRYVETVPMGRQGDAQEIAKAPLFFASDLADFITGDLLPVCGGALMW